MYVYISFNQYIIDVYETVADSASMGIVLTRYLAAGGMVIASQSLYEELGTPSYTYSFSFSEYFNGNNSVFTMVFWGTAALSLALWQRTEEHGGQRQLIA